MMHLGTVGLLIGLETVSLNLYTRRRKRRLPNAGPWSGWVWFVVFAVAAVDLGLAVTAKV